MSWFYFAKMFECEKQGDDSEKKYNSNNSNNNRVKKLRVLYVRGRPR